MNLVNLKIENFCGYAGTHEFTLPKVACMNSANGSGKTSLFNAIRYVLAGIEPAGTVIHTGATSATVEIKLDTGVTFKRRQSFSSTGIKNQCYVNGTPCKRELYNAQLENEIKVPVTALENVMSADIFKTLNSKDFGKYVLSCISEKLTKRDILSFIKNSTIEQMNIVDNFLPEIIELDDIEEFAEMLKTTRKELSVQVKSLKALLTNYDVEKPEKDISELNEELEALIFAERELELYTKEVAHVTELRQKQGKLKASLEEEERELASISNCQRPLEEDYQKIKEDLDYVVNVIATANATISAAENANTTLQNSVEALKSNRCPWSEEVVCSTDKSSTIQNILDSIEVNNLSILNQKDVIEKSTEKRCALEKQKEDWENNNRQYNRCIDLTKSIAAKKQMLIDIKEPEKPNVPENIVVEKASVNKKIAEWRVYAEKKKTQTAIENLEKELSLYTKLSKEFDDGGDVLNQILSFYSEILDEAVNEKAALCRKGMKVHFIPNKGLQVTADVGEGFVSYETLSKGEQTDIVYIIIDLINQLSGSKILLLDETSVLDKQSFEQLLNCILQDKDSYDHIIIAGVNNCDIMGKYNIPVLSEKKD